MVGSIHHHHPLVIEHPLVLHLLHLLLGYLLLRRLVVINVLANMPLLIHITVHLVHMVRHHISWSLQISHLLLKIV